MDYRLLLTLLILVVLAIIFIAGRIHFLRSTLLRRRQQMSDMYTNITHELLTPLTVISASIDKLREDSPQHGHDYDLMQVNIQRMVRLLQQILETSKSESGQLRLLVSQGDIMKYVRETAECIEPLIAHKHMRFSVTCQPESMMGWIDTDKLDKIIYNLLSNAAKYAKENGEVTIKAVTNKTYDHIIIEVSDTGDGIPSEMMRQLYKRFQDGAYRQHNTIGTGLGLALTRDLVFLHNGTIHCDSAVGKGTTFTVSLPINKEAFLPEQIDERHKIDLSIPKNAIIDFNAINPNVNEEADHPDAASEGRDKILIVEDNLELLMLMQQVMKSRYRVYIAQNGVEALKIVRQKQLDLIVSDVMMPQMDGYELTRAVKADANYNRLPIILLTARTQEEDEKEALQAGADDFLTKPFKLSDLRLRIENIIENRKRMQAEQAGEEMTATPAAPRPLTPEEIFINKAQAFVIEHLANEEYDREALAADMGASSSTLYNKLKATTGMNVSMFIRDIRMKEAKRIAQENPKIRVSDLAYRVGFHDPRYFSTCFKKHYGLQPKEYLDSLQKNGATA